MPTGQSFVTSIMALPCTGPGRMQILLGWPRRPARAVLNPSCAGSLLSGRWRAAARPTGRRMHVRFTDCERLLEEVGCLLAIDAESDFGEVRFCVWDGLHETVDAVLGRDMIELLTRPVRRPASLRLVYSERPGTRE